MHAMILPAIITETSTNACANFALGSWNMNGKECSKVDN